MVSDRANRKERWKLVQAVALVLWQRLPVEDGGGRPEDAHRQLAEARCQLPQYSLAMEASGGATGPSTPERLRRVL